jgi:hypothetical protein
MLVEVHIERVESIGVIELHSSQRIYPIRKLFPSAQSKKGQ